VWVPPVVTLEQQGMGLTDEYSKTDLDKRIRKCQKFGIGGNENLMHITLLLSVNIYHYSIIPFLDNYKCNSVLQDLTQSRQRSEALHLQLEGLLSAVSPNHDEKETDVQLMKAVEEKTDLLVEVEKLKSEVEEWKEKYQQENDEKEISEDVR
jgi:hypothetical protein